MDRPPSEMGLAHQTDEYRLVERLEPAAARYGDIALRIPPVRSWGGA